MRVIWSKVTKCAHSSTGWKRIFVFVGHWQNVKLSGVTHALARDQANSQCGGVAITYRNYTQYSAETNPSLSLSLNSCLMTDRPPLQVLTFFTFWLEVTSGNWQVKCMQSAHRHTWLCAHEANSLFRPQYRLYVYFDLNIVLCMRPTVIETETFNRWITGLLTSVICHMEVRYKSYSLNSLNVPHFSSATLNKSSPYFS